MEKPIVSVIVPVYNAEKYIENCINSLLCQTLQHLEIICVDNCSTDKSWEKLVSFNKSNPDKIVLASENKKGVWHARIKGLSIARGDYIAFCDSDDMVAEDIYLEMMQSLIHQCADMCVCGFQRIDENGKFISEEMSYLHNESFDMPDHLMIYPIINTSLWNKLFKKSLFQHLIDFPDPPRIFEDGMFLLSVYPRIKRISFVEDTLYYYYVRKGSAMSYVKPEEIKNLFDNMVKTKKWVMDNSKWKEIDIIVDIMAFIHIGMSFLTRLSSMGISYKEIRQELNNHYSEYRHFNINCVDKRYRKKYYYIWLMSKIFNTPFGGMAIKLYRFITQKLRIEIKW